MKVIKFIVAAAVILIILNGCSGYQLSGRKETVSVMNISPKTFTVNFCGNAYMSKKEVEKYTFQRASEVALSKGYSHFVVLNKSDNSEMCMLNSGGQHDSVSGSGVRDSSAYAFQPFMKPNLTLTIQCFSKGEKMPEGAIDADEFLRQNFPGLKK